MESQCVQLPARVVGVGGCPVNYSALVPTLPSFGSTVQIPRFLRDTGGPVATALIALTRLGVATTFFGITGGDDDGAFFRTKLAGHGVDTTALEEDPEACTRVVVALVDAHTGDRGFLYRPDNCRPLRFSESLRQAIGASRVVLLEDASPTSAAAARFARSRGVTVVFDAGWVSPGFDEVLPYIDHLIASVEFAETWRPGKQPCEVFSDLQHERTCILTLGAEGSLVYAADGPLRFPALEIEPLDTTGAGDAFHAGYIYGLLHGWSVAASVRFATAMGALNCRGVGATASLPSLAEVLSLLGADFRR